MKKLNNITNNYYSDEWYTDAETAALCYAQLGFIPRRVLCPYDTSESEFVKAAHRMGSTPIYGMRDFLTERYEADAIVTNPPFSIKDEVIERCYEYGIPSVLVLPIDSLGGVRRHGLFKKYGQPDVYIPARRIQYFDGTGKNRSNANFHTIIMLLNSKQPNPWMVLE